LTSQKDIKIENQFIFNNFPIKFSKLLEKINVEFLKQKFNEQSNIDIGSYKININSREIILEKKKLKLTEKEIDTILYLSKNVRSVSINELQKEVWSYQSELETHTVETHIHRLRKKIKEKFNDNNLIVSTKDGYQIN
jgi:DNA-binding response OmpR family regulator